MLCHGQGDQLPDLFDGGCCFVAGAVCPNRWYIAPGPVTADRQVFDSTRTLLGTVDQVARSFVGGNPNRRARIAEALQGTLYVCKAAVLAIDAQPSILNNRPAFDAAWFARPEYTPIADAWESIGRPRDWCMIYGPTEAQCCFSETPAVNAARAGVLSTTHVTLRRSARGAS